MKFNKLTWCLVLFVTASTCFAQSRLDQSFTGPFEADWVFYQQSAFGVAQVYTAGIAGDLTSVRLSVFAPDGGPIVVQILDPNSLHNAVWSLLGYAMITPPELFACASICGLASVSFSPPIPQVAGKQYAIGVYPTYVNQTWAGSSSTRYAGGGAFGTWVTGPFWAERDLTLFGIPGPTSFYFQTYVKPSRRK